MVVFAQRQPNVSALADETGRATARAMKAASVAKTRRDVGSRSFCQA